MPSVRMQGNPHWMAPHNEEHDEDSLCRPGEFSPEEWCIPVGDAEVLRCTTTGKRTPASYERPPSHYAGQNGLDPWAVVDAFGLDFYRGNVLKYILRAGRKEIAPSLDDLKKARNYLNKAIELEEGRQ